MLFVHFYSSIVVYMAATSPPPHRVKLPCGPILNPLGPTVWSPMARQTIITNSYLASFSTNYSLASDDGSSYPIRSTFSAPGSNPLVAYTIARQSNIMGSTWLCLATNDCFRPPRTSKDLRGCGTYPITLSGSSYPSR